MVKRWLIALYILLLTAGCVYARGKKPYYVRGYVSTDGGDYSYAGLNIELYNRSEKTITSFTVTFSMYDANGLPLFDDNYKTVTVDCNIPPKDTSETCISLDDYVDDTASLETVSEDDDQWGDPYGVDVIFVDKITYDDGSQWQEQ